MALLLPTLIAPKSDIFVIHKSNSPMVWSINDRSTMVSFSKMDQALFIASLSESHYLSNKEWPMGMKFSFHKQVIPTILGVKNEDYHTTMTRCAFWGIYLLTINDISEKTPLNFSFSGEIKKFEVDYDAQQKFLEYLYIV